MFAKQGDAAIPSLTTVNYTDDGGVTLLEVFYLIQIHTHTHIYIYICVCVCVSVCVYVYVYHINVLFTIKFE